MAKPILLKQEKTAIIKLHQNKNRKPVKAGPSSKRRVLSLSKKVTEKWPFSRIGDENAV